MERDPSRSPWADYFDRVLRQNSNGYDRDTDIESASPSGTDRDFGETPSPSSIGLEEGRPLFWADLENSRWEEIIAL